MKKGNDTKELEIKGALSLEEANALVMEHMGWAESIARSVARSWNMDWRSDGLDGAAMEAIIFCARRFDPERGVPFRGYARRRIHEASTEAARKAKGWRKPSASKAETQAREVSAELFALYPEMRNGQLPLANESGNQDADTRGAVRQLLTSAALIATKQSSATDSPDEALDYKRMVMSLSKLEIVHQILIWKVYWEGNSMRSVATEWDTDELNVIREHKVLLAYLQKLIANSKAPPPIRVRPGLKTISLKLNRSEGIGPFSKYVGAAGT